MELTADQLKAVGDGLPVPVVIDHTECVIIRRDVFEQAQKEDASKTLYDDSDWTDDELRALAGRTVEDADTAGPIE